MANVDEKMRLIGSAVVEQAEQESRSIIDEANAARDRELAEYKEQAINRMFEELQATSRQIRQKAVRDKALAAQQSHRELLRYREELAALVYGAVRARLVEYSGGEAYQERVMASLLALPTDWDHTATTVQLRAADMHWEERIQQLMPGCRVEVDKAIRLGGVRVRNSGAGILLDQTLDSALAESRSWFRQNCGISVTGTP